MYAFEFKKYRFYRKVEFNNIVSTLFVTNIYKDRLIVIQYFNINHYRTCSNSYRLDYDLGDYYEVTSDLEIKQCLEELKSKLASIFYNVKDVDFSSLTLKDFEKDVLFESVVENTYYKNIPVKFNLNKIIPVTIGDSKEHLEYYESYFDNSLVLDTFSPGAEEAMYLPNSVLKAASENDKYCDIRPCYDDPKYIYYREKSKKVDYLKRDNGIQITTIFRFLNYILSKDHDEKEIKSIGDEYLSKVCKLEVVRVHRDSISSVYRNLDYYWGYDSCMSEKNHKYFEIYKDNPDIELFAILDKGEYVGRFLIINADRTDGTKFRYADKVYCKNEYVKHFYIKFCKEQGLYYKSSLKEPMIFINPDTGKQENIEIKFEMVNRICDYKYFPYIDTLRYSYSEESRILTNRDFETPICFTETDGSYVNRKKNE